MLAEIAMLAVTVMPGNTMSGIAQAHHVSLAAVEQANPQIHDPNVIYVGHTVNVPTGHGTATVTVHHGDGDNDSDDGAPALPEHNASPSSIAPVYHHHHYRQSQPATTAPAPASGSYSSSDLASVPGVPRSFAACVAFRESTNGTNAAYNGGVYGIIRASGINVNGQSLAAQKAAFSKLYSMYGSQPWHPSDGC